MLAAKQVDKAALGNSHEIDEAEDEAVATLPASIPPFNMDEFYRKITRWIITANHPFTEVENNEWWELMEFVCPALQNHLVRSTAIQEKLLRHADAAREHTKQYLKHLPGLLAIACDAWTSSNWLAFLAITASWITEDWKLQESLLDFAQLRGTHTGEHMANIVATTIAKLGISDKVVSLVSDNASNNNTLVCYLSSILQRSAPDSQWDGSKGHIHCLAHVIHLAVMALVRGIGAVPESTSTKDYDYEDSTFTEEIAEAFVADDDTELFEHDDEEKIDPLVNLQSGISKIRKITKIVRSSPQHMELFTTIAQLIEDGNEQAAKEQNRPYKRKSIKTLILDVVTRWNSLLFMLERAEEYKEAIDALTTHPKIKIYHPYALSADDWATVSQVCKWLKFFRDASLRVLGEKYPMLSFSLRIYFLLIGYLGKLEKNPSVMESPAVVHGLKACKAKLIEYFDQSTYDSEYYYYAMVLDPRYKDTLFKANSPLLEELFSKEWVSDCAGALVETCQQLYDPDSKVDTNELQPKFTTVSDIHDFESAFRASIPQRSSQSFGVRTVSKEIADYLSEDVIPKGKSPLTWWKANAPRFPRLARMAQDFLCIPGSSVSVKRVLSIGHDVISLRRPSLSATTIQSLMTYRATIMLEKCSSRSAL